MPIAHRPEALPSVVGGYEHHLKEHRRGRGYPEWLRRASARVRKAIRPFTPERLFWIGFAVALAVFVYVLLTEPSSVGRGGR